MTIDEFIDVREVDDAREVAGDLFARKYRVGVPDFPHHVIAFFRGADGSEVPACYIHFTDCGDILLGGGACTDDRILRRMSEAQRDALRAVGGVYQHALTWAVRHFGQRFAAVFGYCGDPLAARVDLAAGFAWTDHPHLLVYWTRDVDAVRRRQMLAKAHSFGAF